MNAVARRLFRFRLARFVTVGAGAALLLFLLVWLFARLGLPPFWGAALAYAVAFAVAYTAQRNWTFGGGHRHAEALPRYLAVQLGCGLLSGVVGHLSVELFSLPPAAMSAAVTLAASAASYVLTSRWAFREQS